MIPVAEAQARMLATLRPTDVETVPLVRANGRILADPLIARRTQPPADFSAMDGYAFRAADAGNTAIRLRLAGESRAGHGLDAPLGHGEAVRIFTGAPLPEGADTVLIQEDARVEDGFLCLDQAIDRGANVRPRGLDFEEGAPLLDPGIRLASRHIALAAAADHDRLPVHCQPRVALLATGDELTPPGVTRAQDAIVDALSPSLSAFIEARGGMVVEAVQIRDDAEALAAAVLGLPPCNLIVTLGGASVGALDLIRPVLPALGLRLDFWKIAMRPGKPLLFGDFRGTPLIGLPGNPVSALVTALLFLGPALDRLAGAPPRLPHAVAGRLSAPLPENGPREAYLRARLRTAPDGEPLFEPQGRDDSSLLSSFAAADCLIIRPPHAPPAHAGDSARALPID